ncbi:MAG TPA: uroporphyrinogen decarboxylase family protein [Tepidisphaeraceae bacterium]
MEIELDLDRFWAENAASSGKAFSTDKPRAPIDLPMDDHWLLEEMQLPSTVRYYRDAEYAAQVNRRCNDRIEVALGIRPFSQTPQPPAPLRIEEVFGARREVIEGGTPWLEPGVSTVEELRALIDRLQRLDDAELRGLIYSNGANPAPRPPGPNGEKQTVSPWSRGPATIGTSAIGTTPWLYWLLDYPADMERFYELLADIMIRYQRIVADANNLQLRGYALLDDNCALLSPELYEQFCFPVVRKLFAAFAPAAGDFRFQHSDSAMAHLLPILNRCDLKGVNFGPTIPAAEIRRQMPRAEICGQIAPMTLRNQSFDAIAAEVKRDFNAVGADGGLKLTTAGSISAGTSLANIRALMYAVDRHARYDG